MVARISTRWRRRVRALHWSRSSSSRTRRSRCGSVAAGGSVELVRLLDLPDEALALLERGTLSAGHGRALLTATDHADRRAWRARGRGGLVGASVESPRARGESGCGNRGTRTAGAGARLSRPARCVRNDRRGAGTALGADVRVSVARGGAYRAELLFASPEEGARAGRATAPAVVRLSRQPVGVRWRRRRVAHGGAGSGLLNPAAGRGRNSDIRCRPIRASVEGR